MARKTITVETPEWESQPVTTLRKWNAREWLAYQDETSALVKTIGEEGIAELALARVIVWSAINGDGSPCFARPDISALRSASADTVTGLLQVYHDLLDDEATVVRRLSFAAISFQDIWEDKQETIAKN